jgi:toxin ParE1/3/4
MARIVWAPRALRDLEELVGYIARDAPVAARRFAQKIVARVELLGHHPWSGATVPEDVSGIYREVRQGAYRVIYRTDGETVNVVGVHHAARLLDTGDLG